jgi:hypothetical protein
MTKVPKELILIGDGFESDPVIYMTLKKLLTPHADPWKTWKSIKNNNIFNLTSKQDSHFITKFYLLSELAKKSAACDVRIHIRATSENIEKLQGQQFGQKSLTQMNQTIDYYLNTTPEVVSEIS